MIDIEWMHHATRFTFQYRPQYGNVPVREAHLERRDQRDGRSLWAVSNGSSCLNKDGDWEYEPIPSSRDDEFIARCRYATKEEALVHLEMCGAMPWIGKEKP